VHNNTARSPNLGRCPNLGQPRFLRHTFLLISVTLNV
jgi:hypothetical protein